MRALAALQILALWGRRIAEGETDGAAAGGLLSKTGSPR